MPISVKHKKIATVPDDPNYEINTTEWNNEHDLTGAQEDLGVAVNAAIAAATTLSGTDPVAAVSLLHDPESVTSLGTLIHAAENVTTPAETDEVPIVVSGVARKITWVALLAAAKTYFGGFFTSITGGYINGQRDTRTDIVASTDGATYVIDCSLGNAFKVTPTDSAGWDYTLNFTNIPAGATTFSFEVHTIVGTNLPTVAYQVAGVAITPKPKKGSTFPAFEANSTLELIFSTIDGGATLTVRGSSF